MKRALLIALLMSWMAAGAMADWMPGDPAKWVQMPDLTNFGLDVLANSPRVLADDFLCTSRDPITDVHIWGSWIDNALPINPSTGQADPKAVGFRLSIHSDIPASEDPQGNPIHSRPGKLLWEAFFGPGEFQAVLYAQVPKGEAFYDPTTGAYVQPPDQQVWQYNFLIDPDDTANPPFQQQGTPNDPVVYWLDVSVFPISVTGVAQPLFGWKSSVPADRWNDDAVWRNTLAAVPTWNELRYPAGHPYGGESLDFAFVITPEPAMFGLLGVGALALWGRRRH